MCPLAALANELTAQCKQLQIYNPMSADNQRLQKQRVSIDEHYRNEADDDNDDDDGYAMTMASEICGNNTSEVHKMRNNQNAKHYEGQSMRCASHTNAQ